MKTRIFVLDVGVRKEEGEDEMNHYFDGTVNKKQSKREMHMTKSKTKKAKVGKERKGR